MPNRDGPAGELPKPLMQIIESTEIRALEDKVVERIRIEDLRLC